MCKGCLFEQRPERGRVCRENGFNPLNYKGCHECGYRGPLKAVDLEEETEEDGEDLDETVTYKHACAKCGHIVCEHFYQFQISSKYDEYDDFTMQTQEFLMECMLCGKGCDTVKLEGFDGETRPEHDEAAYIAMQREKDQQPMASGEAGERGGEEERPPARPLAIGAGMEKLRVAMQSKKAETGSDDEWED